MQEATRVGQVEVADIALDRERRLGPVVPLEFRIEVLHLQIAERRIQPWVSRHRFGLLSREKAMGRDLLALDRGRNSPVIAKCNTQRRARTKGLYVVVVVLRSAKITRIRSWIARRRTVIEDKPGSGCTVGISRRIGQCTRNVVDVPPVLFVPADHADRRCRIDGYVDVALARVAWAAVCHVIGLNVVGSLQYVELRLVRDDTQGPGFGTGAVQCPLRSSQRLDARDVVHMDVEHTLDCRDRLLVQIDADAR